MYQKFDSKKDGDSQSVMRLLPSFSSDVSTSRNSSSRSRAEKPIWETSTLKRLRSTRRARECALFSSLKATVSSWTLTPGRSTEGIDDNKSQVHS